MQKCRFNLLNHCFAAAVYELHFGESIVKKKDYAEDKHSYIGLDGKRRGSCYA